MYFDISTGLTPPICLLQVRCASLQPVLQDQTCGDGHADPRMSGDERMRQVDARRQARGWNRFYGGNSSQ